MKITTLEMTGYKKYADKTNVAFGDITVITGENGTGKSTIADAIAFLLYGIDANGGKDIPANLFDPADTVLKAGMTDDSGNTFIAERHIVNGKTKLFINEVPVKAGEFKEVIEQYFTKERFLTLFNPTFFATQHWTAQREQFMANVEEPLIADVLESGGELLRDTLGPELKKLDIDKLEAKQRNIKKTTDAEIIKLRERYETYSKMTNSGQADTKSLELELESIEKDAALLKAYEAQKADYDKLVNALNVLNEKLAKQAEIVNTKKASEPLESCVSCGQKLPEEKILEVEKNMAADLAKAKGIGMELVAERKELKKQIAEHVSPERPNVADYATLVERKMEIRSELAAANAKDYSEEAAAAKTELQKLNKENAKASELIDYIKVYRALKTDMMLRSIDDLFNRLSVKPFNELANGNIETTFEIEYDGKPYRTLSTAERILAGLELRNAFLKLTEQQETVPVFIDNAESISSDVTLLTDGQLIVAEVKRDAFAIEKKERELV